MSGFNLNGRLASLSPQQRALLEKRLHRAAVGREAGIGRRTEAGPPPPSFCQQRLWFMNELNPNSSTYNAPFALRLTGPLNREALQQAVQTIFTRHEVLRTCFDCPGGAPVPTVMPLHQKVLQVVDLGDKPASRVEADVLSLVESEARRPFHLARDLVLRCVLWRLSEEHHLFLHVAHHIAWDYRSKVVFYEELAALYDAALDGQPAPLPELSIQYADFANWQRQRLTGPALDQLVAFWKGQLAEAPAILNLPLDRPRPPVQSQKGAKYPFAVPAALIESAQQLSRRGGVTLFMTLLAAFKTFLHLITGQNDILIGSPIAGRDRPETEPLIGFFINTLVFRTSLAGNPTFRELMKRVRETTMGAFANQEMPFEKLVETLRPPRTLSHNPFFQVNFRVASAPPTALRLRGVTAHPLDLIDTASSKFDLALEIAALEGGIGYWEYSTDLFEECSIARLGNEFLEVLEAVLDQPETPLGAIAVLNKVATRVRQRVQARQDQWSRPRGLGQARRRGAPGNVLSSNE